MLLLNLIVDEIDNCMLQCLRWLCQPLNCSHLVRMQFSRWNRQSSFFHWFRKHCCSYSLWLRLAQMLIHLYTNVSMQIMSSMHVCIWAALPPHVWLYRQCPTSLLLIMVIPHIVDNLNSQYQLWSRLFWNVFNFRQYVGFQNTGLLGQSKHMFCHLHSLF